MWSHRADDAGLRDALTGHYYRHLNQNPAFQQSLAALFDTLAGVALPDRFDIMATLEALVSHQTPIADGVARERGLLAEWQEVLARDDLTEAGRDYWMTMVRDFRARVAVMEPLGSFCQRWPLPPRGPEDLWHSFEVWQYDPSRPPTLDTGVRWGMIPTVGHAITISEHPITTFDRTINVRAVENQPWILPNVPLSFLYDPMEQDRRWLNARIEELHKSIRESIIAQAEVFERELDALGWKQLPAHYRRPGALDRLARWIYLYAVEHRTWEQIADSEEATGEDSRTPDADSIRQSATKAARRLGIGLP